MSKICYTCTEAKSELQNRGKQKGYWLNNMEEIKLDCSVEIKPLKKNCPSQVSEWRTFSPVWSHVLSVISPWAHLLKRGSSKSECLLTMWLKNDLNLAQMIFPFPLGVVVALQWRWFVHGFIQSLSCSLSFSFASFEISFLISV